MAKTFDVCVRGGGVVGHTLALLLAGERLRVGLVTGPARDTASGPDVRAYALNAASRQLLEQLRCWPEGDTATAVQRMLVSGDQGGVVHFGSAEAGADALAWIVDVPALESRLAQAVQFQGLIEMLDAPVAAPLTVVCEGKASQTREELGVSFEATPYHQSAIAFRLNCEKPHAQTAWQWFDQGEILAFLPMGGPQGNSVACVWSVHERRVADLLALTPEAFGQALETASHGALGALSLTSGRSAWPLHKCEADRWCGQLAGTPAGTTGSWVLAGDAAHAVHPLAGQGLNLGLADVRELVQVLHERAYWRSPGDLRVLRRYERARKAGLATLGGAMDGLQLLFARQHPALQSLRNWGMKGFERSGWLKTWVARQAMGSR
jgi:2-polyprenyl-6-methoxyphenol hydroxylase-like FAD-dependent oxidoreductase